MKKNIKRIFAALLCACVLFGGAVTAFASDNDEPVQSYSISNIPDLHPGEQFQMIVQVYPEDAPCTIRYEVDDESVAIIDENGLATLYGHCSALHVTTGQQVKQGQVIADVGQTGYATGPHVHFEVILNGTKVNAMNYFKIKN